MLKRIIASTSFVIISITTFFQYPNDEYILS